MIKKQPSIFFCLLMDLVGYATYAVPFFGEFADLIWAPVSSLIFMNTFGGWRGVLGGFGNLIEELLPGTDFIPSFTIMWFINQARKKEDPAKMKVKMVR